MKHLIIILALFFLPASSYATIFWDDEMEDTIASQFYYAPHFAAGVYTHDTAVKFSGTASTRINYPPECFAGSSSGSQCGGAVRREYPATDNIWSRVYFRMSGSGPNPSASGLFETSLGAFTKMFRGKTDSSSTPSSFWLTMGCCRSKTLVMNMEGVPAPGRATNGFTSITLADNRWYCIETHEQVNTPGVANGIAEVWVDGAKVYTNLAVMWRQSGSSIQWLDFSLVRQEGNGNLWFDRFAAGDQRIGCIGSLPVQDTTPPTQPTITSLTTSGTANSLVFTPSTDGGSGMVSHTILYCTLAGCTPSLVAGTAGATATTFLHSSLTANTLYRYQIRGNDVAGNGSTLSAISEVTTVVAAASYYTLVFSDNFNRADAATLGASYQDGYGTDTALRITSEQLRPVAVNQDATQTYITAVPNDIAVSIVLAQGNGSGTRAPGLLTRYADPATKEGYECRILLPATARTGEWNAGSFTQKTSVTISPAWAAGDKLWCETIGTTTSMYREVAGVKTLLTSFSDATHAAGKIGIISYQASGTLGDMQVDDLAVYSVSSTPSTPPSITNAVINASNTAITHTYGATTPTQIRVHYGNNAGTRSSNTVRPIADFPSGVLTIMLPNGTEFYCARPFDAAGVEFSSLGRCINTTSVIAGVDVNPAVMSNPFPSTNRPAGTTEVDYGVKLDKPALCRSHTEPGSYAEMAPPTGTDLTTASLFCSGTRTGLTNGSETILYISSNFTNEFNEEYPSVTNQVVTIVVDSSTADTTPPGAPTDPVASPILNSSDITVLWGEASGGDVARYHIYKAIYSSGACGTYAPSGNTVTTTSRQLSNAPATTYCFKIRAEDISGNLGSFSVETAPVTTNDAPDLEPPSDAGNVTVTPYTHSAVLTWPVPTDNRGKPSTTIELCTGAACSDFLSVQTGQRDDRLELGLQPSTAYRVRIIHCDDAGLCGAYSPIIAFTTTSSGLASPRIPIQFGVTRPPLSAPRLPNAIQRIQVP